MTIETLTDHIRDIEKHHKIYGFFISYKETERIITNKRGPQSEWKNVIKDVQNSKVYIQGVLPIIKIIFYSEWDMFCWVKNPFWSPLDEELIDDDSHVMVSVPYLDQNFQFMKFNDINNERD